MSKDKCSSDQPLEKQKPDDDEDGKEIGERNSGKQIILQIKDKEESGVIRMETLIDLENQSNLLWK